MKSKSGVLWLTSGALLLAGCASGTVTSGGPGSYRVVVASAAQGAGGVDVLTTEKKSVLSLPFGTLSPDGQRLYVTAVNHQGKPQLRSVDTRTGSTTNEMAISAAYFEAPGIISSNGRWLIRSFVDQVLTTHIGVFDTRNLAERALALKGVFALDAIDDAGSVLYLLETVGPNQYRVRDYDLAGDRLDDHVIVDKTDASPVMNGTRVATVATADGEKVFGLYQRPGRPPFIHVLWTTQKLAWCVDLPPVGSADVATGWSLLLDERRARVYAINARGIVAEADYSNLPQLLRTESFQPPPATSWHLPWAPSPFVGDASAKGYEGLAMNGGSALSPDGRTIYVPDTSGYMTIATVSLRPTGRRLSGHSLSSLAISPDGKNVFALQPDSNLVIEVDATSGQQVATFTLPYPVGILKVEAP